MQLFSADATIFKKKIKKYFCHKKLPSKVAHNQCRYNSILLYSTQLPILRPNSNSYFVQLNCSVCIFIYECCFVSNTILLQLTQKTCFNHLIFLQWLMRLEKGKMTQPTTSFMFVENVNQVVKVALMILLALHLIIGHLGNLQSL